MPKAYGSYFQLPGPFILYCFNSVLKQYRANSSLLQLFFNRNIHQLKNAILLFFYYIFSNRLIALIRHITFAATQISSDLFNRRVRKQKKV